MDERGCCRGVRRRAIVVCNARKRAKMRACLREVQYCVYVGTRMLLVSLSMQVVHGGALENRWLRLIVTVEVR